MNTSRLLTVPAKYLDAITHTLDPELELQGLQRYLSGRIVEIFCRTGRIGEYLLREGYSWQGCDPDATMIEYSIRRVGFQVRDVLVPVANSADTILGIFAPLSYISPNELPNFAHKIHTALSENGRAILEMWHTPETAQPRYSLMDLYESSQLKLVRTVVPTIEGRRANFTFHWLVGSTEVNRESFVVVRYLHRMNEIQAAFSLFEQQLIDISDRSYLLLSKNVS
ncbi:MAG: class I SAM-dependent methyltransferase [Myxococcota bacterium]|nr:class I SAM-dependent methyltransferase [Myxococcota bacterium]